MQLAPKGRPALWLVVSLVFAGFLFAVGAQAQGANALEVATDSPPGEAAPESGVSPEQTPPATEEALPTGAQAPAAAEQTSPTVEQDPPATEQTSPEPEEAEVTAEQTQSPVEPPDVEDPSPPAEQTPPVAEQTPPPVEQTPPPVEQTPPPVEQTPPPVEQTATPPAGQTPPVEQTIPEQIPSADKEAPLTVEGSPPDHEPQTAEQTGKASGETSSEGGVTEGAGDSQTPTGASGSDRREPANEVAPAPFTAATAPNVAISMPGAPTPAAGKNQASASLGAPTTLARQSQRVSRELAAFGAWTIGTGYAGRWMDTSGAALVSTVAFATVGTSPAAMIATSVPARDKDGGQAVENHLFSPIPGSGGGGGGSAAGGSSGSASSAPSILVGALLQTAPSVMRLLCVSQPSWRTTFFALIPERPD